MSVRGNVLVGICPVGEVSGRGIVRSGKSPSGKFPSGNCPRGSVSRGTVRQPLLVYALVCSSKFPVLQQQPSESFCFQIFKASLMIYQAEFNTIDSQSK